MVLIVAYRIFIVGTNRAIMSENPEIVWYMRLLDLTCDMHVGSPSQLSILRHTGNPI